MRIVCNNQCNLCMEEVINIVQDDKKVKVFNWSTKITPYEKHRDSKALRHPNTVLWFFDSFEYKNWVGTPNSAIWLFGIRKYYILIN